MQARLTLQERLAVLVVAAVLPLAVLSLWFAVRDVRSTTELAQSQLRFAASAVAASQERAADSVHHMLAAVAAMPEIASLDPAGCSQRLLSMQERFPEFSNMGLATAQGDVICLARGTPEAAARSVADRLYFRRALALKRFVMGEAIEGRHTGAFALAYALPVLDAQSGVQGVLFAAQDLGKASAALGRLDLPEGARVTIADRAGRALMVYPAGARAPGEPMRVDLLRSVAARMEARAGEFEFEGRPRFYAAVPTRAHGDERLLAIVSQEPEQLVPLMGARLRNLLIATGLTLLAGLLGAWWLGTRVIVKPAKQILGAVKRLEQGRLDARVPVHARSRRSEFGRIAAAFNLMAESLQMRRLDLEAELARSRGAYAVIDTVLNSMQEGLVAVDRMGQFLMVNQAAARLFPMHAQKLLPEHWPERFGLLVPGTGLPFAPEDMPMARAVRGESGDVQVLVRNEVVPQGRLLNCSYLPLHNDTGLDGGLVVFTDVTELEHAQADLLRFSGMLQRTAEAAQAIARERVLEGTLREVRRQACLVLDAGTCEITLQAPPAHAAVRVERTEARILVPLTSGPGAAIGTLVLTREDGPAFDERDEYVCIELAQLAATAIENAQLLGQVRELNAGLEARIAERTTELARQEQRYRALAEQAPEVVWNVDPAGKATFFSRAWYELVGGEPGDWLGDGWVSRVHPEDVGPMHERWEASREGLQSYIGTRRIRARDGSWHTMAFRAAPVLDDAGQVVSWVGIDSDITELKAIEAALRTSNQELEAFSYSVSHDLRAPLAAIDGFSSALAQKLGSSADDKVRHYIARVQAGVKKMEQLIEALLSLSRVSRAPLQREQVDLAALAREVIDTLQQRDPGRNVQVVVQGGLQAEGDSALLRIALHNLIGNAWKFTSQRADARIEVGSEAGAFFVRDNGVGFDMAYADKLFTAFQRLHTEREFPGTGIGLATVRRIIVRHHGRVWAESQPGEGTVFRFTLDDPSASDVATGFPPLA